MVRTEVHVRHAEPARDRRDMRHELQRCDICCENHERHLVAVQGSSGLVDALRDLLLRVLQQIQHFQLELRVGQRDRARVAWVVLLVHLKSGVAA